MVTELERLSAIELRLKAEIDRLDKIINLAQKTRSDNALAATLSAYNALLRVRDGLHIPAEKTEDTLRRWLGSIDIPTVTDIFQASGDVFYATFMEDLNAGDHVDHLRSIGIEVAKSRPSLPHRYMLTWTA